MTEAARACVDFGFRAHGRASRALRRCHRQQRELARHLSARLSLRGHRPAAELVAARWLDHAIFARLSSDE